MVGAFDRAVVVVVVAVAAVAVANLVLLGRSGFGGTLLVILHRSCCCFYTAVAAGHVVYLHGLIFVPIGIVGMHWHTVFASGEGCLLV